MAGLMQYANIDLGHIPDRQKINIWPDTESTRRQAENVIRGALFMDKTIG
jgi:hypothetical protein